MPSNRGLISKIRPSDGCKGNTVPSTVVRGYDLRKPGGHLGNVGLVENPGRKLATKPQSFLVDPVFEPRPHVPLDVEPGLAEHFGRGMQCDGRYQRIVVAMDQQDRRSVPDFGRDIFGIGHQARVADDPSDRLRPARPNMQRHHRSLAETDQHQRCLAQRMTLKFAVDEVIQRRRGGDSALAHPDRVDRRQRKPLSANRRLAAGIRRVGRNERCIGQHRRPPSADLDQIVAVGAVTVQEDHQAACDTAGRRKPRPVELGRHAGSPGWARAAP